MKAKKFEQQFDEGIDITAALNISKAQRVLHEHRQIDINLPTWIIDSIDRAASEFGVSRQSIIKAWLAERLEKAGSNLPLRTTRSGVARR